MDTIAKLVGALGCALEHLPADHPDAVSAREALAEYDESQRLELPTDYRATLEIDAFNATSPRQPAEEAWQRMRRVDSTANVFTVYGRDGSITDVDLSEDEE